MKAIIVLCALLLTSIDGRDLVRQTSMMDLIPKTVFERLLHETNRRLQDGSTDENLITNHYKLRQFLKNELSGFRFGQY